MVGFPGKMVKVRSLKWKNDFTQAPRSDKSSEQIFADWVLEWVNTILYSSKMSKVYKNHLTLCEEFQRLRIEISKLHNHRQESEAKFHINMRYFETFRFFCF